VLVEKGLLTTTLEIEAFECCLGKLGEMTQIIASETNIAAICKVRTNDSLHLHFVLQLQWLLSLYLVGAACAQ